VAGSVLIAALTTSFLAGIQQNPDVPEEVNSQAGVGPGRGVPFISQEELTTQMAEAGVAADLTDQVVEQYNDSQIDGLRNALAALAVMGVIALFFTGRIPKREPGSAEAPS
jgi:hypothetical protein